MANYRQSGFPGFPPAIRNLIIINFIVWFIEITVSGNWFENLFALHDIRGSYFRIWQFFTYMFLHDPKDVMHIIFNMFALWMFGGVLENFWGSKRFTWFYLICGVGAGLIYSAITFFHNTNLVNQLVDENPGVPFALEQARDIVFNNSILGASGAVFGVLVAFGYSFPNTEMIIIPIPVPVKAKYLVIGYILIELFGGVRDRPGDNVAHFAHLGGALVGFLLVRFWNKTNRRD